MLVGWRLRRRGAARDAALRLLLRLRSGDWVCISRGLGALVVLLLLLLQTMVASRDCAAEEVRVQAI